MSQRHRSQDSAPVPKMDMRAHAHNERHRINSELQSVAAKVSAGYEPDEVHEPGRAWVPEHHRTRKASGGGKSLRHWKVKAWKRRSTVRKAKAQAMRLAGDQP
ncbi:MAG TPA: hypothetical protein DCR14_12695 [Acidimicrobiaceae bacterium]|nr:hypothetical protein [Acidimicrobiaceae bacterium]